MRMFVPPSSLAALGLLLSAGCGGALTEGGLDASSPELKEELIRFSRFYNDYVNANFATGPSTPRDLRGAMAQFPHLYQLIEAGRFVVVWRAELSDNGTENDKYVLAYDKNVPETGGWVLRAGGTVQRMTPAEFKQFRLARSRTLP